MVTKNKQMTRNRAISNDMLSTLRGIAESGTGLTASKRRQFLQPYFIIALAKS
jgi:hypothetical protein